MWRQQRVAINNLHYNLLSSVVSIYLRINTNVAPLNVTLAHPPKS